MTIIASEQQAEAIGQTLGRDYTVFSYELRPERITAFGVKLDTGQIITRTQAGDDRLRPSRMVGSAPDTCAR